jgi:hypothetical protein
MPDRQCGTTATDNVKKQTICLARINKTRAERTVTKLDSRYQQPSDRTKNSQIRPRALKQMARDCFSTGVRVDPCTSYNRTFLKLCSHGLKMAFCALLFGLRTGDDLVSVLSIIVLLVRNQKHG